MNQQSIPHDYYYGCEAEQYTFYRFPKALFTNDRYKNMSDSAKILYGLMLDRMGLSLKNGWLDDANRVFIYFTLEDLQEYMNCGHNKGVKLMAELDNIDLIERVKQGLGRPAIIYVKRFSNDTVYPNQPPPNRSYPQSSAQGNPDFRKAETQTSDNGKSRLPHKGSTDFPKANANKNKLNNLEFNKNDFSKNYPIQSYQQYGEPDSPHGLDKDVILNMNRQKLMAGFKHLNGITIYAFVKQKRMQKALPLLLETEMPIFEISCLVGCHGDKHFQANFKEFYSTTPSKLHFKVSAPAND